MEPGGEGAGLEPRDQPVIGQHHQPLDVVGVAVLGQLRQHRVHAGHATGTVVEPGGQGGVGLKLIAGAVVGTKPVVEAMGVLAPTQDLADHPLQASQRHRTV